MSPTSRHCLTAAKRITESAYWTGNLGIWGEQLIEGTADGQALLLIPCLRCIPLELTFTFIGKHFMANYRHQMRLMKNGKMGTYNAQSVNASLLV